MLCGNGKRSAATRSSGSTGAAEHAAANLGQSKEILMATADAAAVNLRTARVEHRRPRMQPNSGPCPIWDKISA